MGNINSIDIIHAVEIGLLVAFILVVLVLVLCFVRGLFRGWKYGTYRLAAFIVLVVIACATLKPIANWMGNLDFTSLKYQISFLLQNGQDTATISVQFTTLYATIKEIIVQVLTFYGASGSAETLANYALAMSQSLTMLALIFVDGVLLGTLGQLFILILWHVAFKHIIPRKQRKIKKLRWLSGLEESVIGLVTLAMLIFPFSSILNAVNNHYDRSKDTTLSDSNLSLVTDVLNTYQNSIFSSIFFNWSKGDGTDTFDTELVSFLSQGDYDGVKGDVVGTVGSLVDIGSAVVNSGVLSEEGIQDIKIGSLLTGSAIPNLLLAISDSSLVQNALPVAVEIALSMDQVKAQLGEEECAYLSSDAVNWTNELKNLAKIYRNVLDSGILQVCLDEKGNFVFTPKDLLTLFSPDGNAYGAVHAALSNSENSKIIDHLISGFVYTFANSANQVKDDDPTTIQLIDFLPKDSTDPTKPSKEGISSIKWFSEVGRVYDAFYKINLVDSSILDSLIGVIPTSTSQKKESQSSSSGTSSSSGGAINIPYEDIISLFAKHGKEIGEIIIGPTDKNGNLVGIDSSTGEYSGGCLFDSVFVQNFIPTLLPFLEATLNSSLELPSGKQIDFTAAIAKLNDSQASIQLVNYKKEIAHILTIVDYFTSSPVAIEFISNPTSTPGIYFDPDKNFDSIDPGLLSALISALREMDKSVVVSSTLPAIFDSFMTGPDSPLAQFDLPIALNFNVPDLGSQLAYLLTVYQKCPNVFAAAASSSGAAAGSSLLSSIGDNSEELVRLLDMFVNSKILNPDSGGDKNANFFAFLNYAFKSAGLSEFTLDENDPRFDGIQLGNSLTADGDFFRNASGEPIYDGETGSLAKVFVFVANSGIVDQLSSLSGSSSSSAIDILSGLDIQGLFNAIGDSKIMSAIAGPALDKYFGSVLDQAGLSTVVASSSTVTSTNLGTISISGQANRMYSLYLNYGAADQQLVDTYTTLTGGSYVFTNLSKSSQYTLEVSDVMGSISFKNVTDWSYEGTCFTTLIKAASSGLDLENVDFLNSDPTNVVTLFKALASSRIFVKTNADGTSEYTFPEYLYRKFVSSLDVATSSGRDAFKYFVDEGTVLTNPSDYPTTLEGKTTVTKQLHADFAAQATMAEWVGGAGQKGQCEKFGDVVRDILRLPNGLNSVASISYDEIASVSSLLNDVNETECLGRVIIYNVLENLFSGLSDSTNGINFANANTSFMMNPLGLTKDSGGVISPNEIERSQEISARSEEISRLLAVMKVAYDPSNGLVNSSGRTDTSSLTIGNISTEHLLKPLLINLSKSAIFNSLKPGVDKDTAHLTVFESAIERIVIQIKVYSDSASFDGDTPLNSHTDVTLNSLIIAISNASSDSATGISWGEEDGAGNLTGELGTLIDIVECVKNSDFIDSSGQFTTSFLDDIPAYFSGSASQIEEKKGTIREVLSLINKSNLLSRLLAPKLATAFDNVTTSSSSSVIAEDVKKYADPYCMASATDYAPYQDEDSATLHNVNVAVSGSSSMKTVALYLHNDAAGTYSELSNLVDILSDMAKLSGLDISNVKSFDSASLTDALSRMTYSSIFNSVSNDPTKTDLYGHTCFQLIVKDVFDIDVLADYVYGANNPKDIANHGVYGTSNRSQYQNASEKSYAAVDEVFNLGNSDPKDIAVVHPFDHSYSEAALDKVSAVFVNNLGDGSSLLDLLDLIKSSGYSSILSSGGSLSFDDITGDQIHALLSSLNKNALFYDCVPNLIGKITSNSSFRIGDATDAIDISLCNPYFSYWLDSSTGEVGTMTLASGHYKNHFDENELDQISIIMDFMEANRTALTDMKIDSLDATMVRTLLLDMYNSYVFHRAGVNTFSPQYGTSPTYDGATSSYRAPNDLTVFEQMVFRVYDKSNLDERAYSSYYDYNDYYRTYGSTGYVIKLHDRIKGFTVKDSFGHYVQDGLHTGDWLSEIDALTTDGLIHEGTAEDPYVGVVCTVNKLHIFSGEEIALDPSKLQNFNPDSLNKLMHSLNQLDIVADALPYTIKSLLTTTTETTSGGGTMTTGFRLNQFSEDTETLTIGPVNSYTTPNEINGHAVAISKISVSSTDAPSSVVATFGDGSSETLTLSPSVSGSVYTYDVSSLKATSFTLSDPSNTFTPISLSYDSAVYDLSQSEFLTERSETPESVAIVSYTEPSVLGTLPSGSNVNLALTPTITGTNPSTYTYDLSALTYSSYTFEGSTSFKNVEFNGATVTLLGRTKRWTTPFYNDIDCLTTLLSSLYDYSSGKYFSFDDANGLQTFFSTGHSTNGILKFFLDCDYYTKLSYSSSGYSFLSRDVTLFNFFSYKYSDPTNPALNTEVKLGSNIGGISGTGDLSYVLTSHQKISELEKIFQSESASGIVSARWIKTESEWIDENLVSAGLLQSALSNVGPLSYPIMLRVLGLPANAVKLSNLMDSLVPDPAAPSYVSRLGSHILAGQLTTMNYLRWTNLSDSSNFVSPSGTTIDHDHVFGAGVSLSSAVPNLYGPNEAVYSMATSYSFASLYENGCAIMKAESHLAVASGLLLKDPTTDPLTASDKVTLVSELTALDSLYYSGSCFNFLNLAYLPDLYNGFVLQGYFYNNFVTMTDFPSPLAMGYIASMVPNANFSFLTLSGLVS